MAAYERALAARERLSKANPTTTRHVEQQIGLHRMIGSLHERAGRPTDARASYERGRAIGEKAADHAPRPRNPRGIGLRLPSLGDSALGTGEASEATAKYERMRATVAKLVEAHPSRPSYRSPLADCIRRHGSALQAAGRAADAIAHYRQSLAELERLEKPTPVDLYDMACCRSLIAGAARSPARD